MSTRTADDTATIGSIEEFLQQCLEDMEPDHMNDVNHSCRLRDNHFCRSDALSV